MTCTDIGPVTPSDYCLMNGIKYYNNCKTCENKCTLDSCRRELAALRKNVPANIALSAAPLIIKTWTITGAAVPYGAGLNKTAKFKEQQTKEKDDEQEV